MMGKCPICSRWVEDGPGDRCPYCTSEADVFGTLGLPAEPPRFHEPDERADREPDPGPLGTIGLPTWAPAARADWPAVAPTIPIPTPWIDRGPRYAVQIRRGCRWVELGEPSGAGLTLRRRARGGAVGRLARFVPAGDGLRINDLGAGVLRRLRGPVELADGDRLRLGGTDLAFRRDGLGLARLARLRPDGAPGPSYALDAPTTVVGRMPGEADIALADDRLVSARHLAVRRDGSRYVAEDLGSTNGSFLAVPDGALARPGEALLVGGRRVRVVAIPDPASPFA